MWKRTIFWVTKTLGTRPSLAIIYLVPHVINNVPVSFNVWCLTLMLRRNQKDSISIFSWKPMPCYSTWSKDCLSLFVSIQQSLIKYFTKTHPGPRFLVRKFEWDCHPHPWTILFECLVPSFWTYLGRIRRYGLVGEDGEGVALSKENVSVSLKFQKPMKFPKSSCLPLPFLLPLCGSDVSSHLLHQHHICHAPCHNGHEL